MLKKIFLVIFSLLFGIICMICISKFSSISLFGKSKPVVIGFLPYWLINKNKTDYTQFLSSISYFSLTINADGTLQRLTKPTETEPGWLSLGKMSSILDSFKKKKLHSSLVVFCADQENISQLIENPIIHATNLVREVAPIITKYGFTDLNLDIESVSLASDSARKNFTLFTKTVHEQIQKYDKSITLSIDVSPTALIRPYLVDISSISSFIDKIIFMTYDFHYQGSSVTGAVAPINGAGKTAEYDTETSIKEALKVLPPEKIVLGVPLYGYEWETLLGYPSAAVIPGTGITASNKRVEILLSSCASCSAQFDPISKETYVIYKDQATNTFHQIFYPDKKAIQAKIELMKKYDLGGIALWALGYEGNTILDPLRNL